MADYFRPYDDFGTALQLAWEVELPVLISQANTSLCSVADSNVSDQFVQQGDQA